MSVAAELPSSAKLVAAEDQRAILGPGGNTLRASEEVKRSKKEDVVLVKKAQRLLPKTDVEKNKSDGDEAAARRSYGESLGRCGRDDAERLCSSDSSSASGSTAKKSASCGMRVKLSGSRSLSAGQEKPSPAVKRCHWITPHSDQLYITFHDEEWGVPVHDDKKLFELLVFSQALAELNWFAILQKREAFRKYFDGFDAASVAQFTDATKLISLEAILSKPKVEAIVENAKQIIKVQQEFGSFNKYCWSFVNHKPIRNSIRYANQIPAKSPKAQLISKDMMRRGFRCVGPTVVYSFMQAAGIVNDHLVSCFRYQECTADITKKPVQENEEMVS